MILVLLEPAYPPSIHVSVVVIVVVVVVVVVVLVVVGYILFLHRIVLLHPEYWNEANSKRVDPRSHC